MDAKVASILALIQTGGDWQTPFINQFDCIKNLADYKAIDTMLQNTVHETITLNANATGDLTFLKEANHSVVVADSTTAATAGGNLTLQSAAGFTSGAGGTLAVLSGAGGATGAGGPITLTTGAGGSTSGASGAFTIATGVTTAESTSASGALDIRSGLGSNSTGGTAGGASGAFTVGTKAGGTTATGTGGVSGAVDVSSGAGGAASGNGTGGASGTWTGRTGAGGAAAGTGAAVGGASAAWSGGTGAGGAAAGTSVAGASGVATLSSGAGGAKTGAGAANGGASGNAVVASGNGGATAGTTGTGGAAGDALVTAGNGGAASAGTANGGAAGSVIATAGTGGTSAGGTAGMDGSVYLRGKQVLRKQGAPTAKTVTAAISAAELATGIITTTGVTGPSVHQLPTGTLLLAEFPDAAAGDSFDFYVINTGVGAATDATVTVNTDVTIVGNPTVGSLVDATQDVGSGHFRARYTGGVTWVVYRLA